MSYKETMIKKYGSLELWKAHMAKIGSKGGSNGVGHEFAHGRVDPAKAGKVGGARSKRTSKKAGR